MANETTCTYWKKEADEMWSKFVAATATDKWVVFGEYCRVVTRSEAGFKNAKNGAGSHRNQYAIEAIKKAEQYLKDTSNKMRAALGLPLV